MQHTLTTLLTAACFAAPALAQGPDPSQLAQRAAIAAQIRQPNPGSVDTPSNAEIEAALDLAAGVVTSIATSGQSAQIAAPAGLGVIPPRAGTTFLLLSSGAAGTAAPEPGSGYGAYSGAFGNDTASVTLTLTVPPQATTLRFDYRFFSAEYPDFVQAGFNDTFTALVNGNSVASQSVDAANFFPAFASNAGGTGFDIFCPDPSGVDTSFPGGLPDAGLTDWLSASVAVVPGSTITVVFGIGDFGDDILDSAVLIDNVGFASIEALDGDDDRFRDGGDDVTDDADVLAVGGEARIGLCADGVARLLLRANLAQAGTMTFTLPNWVDFAESGGLGAPGAPPVGATITVNSVLTAQGHKAFAVLRAPLDFVRLGVPADATARTRQLTVTTSFQAGGGAPVAGNLQLVLERPPVVLCHGLWSNPATWNNFAPLIGNPLWDFQRVDYSNNNAGPFAINRFQVRRNATTARDAKKRRGIASAQVDWVGHSMGGLLPRSWVRSGFFLRPDNFGMGDLHKLVTLNTPHWGSPMANLLVSLRGIPIIGDYLIVGMERMGMSIIGGAVDNLAEGSAALAAIGVTPVRSHSIAGKGGSEAIGVADVGLGVAATLSPPPFNGLFRLLNVISFATTATLYRFQEHDFIVLLPSQIGGLFGATTTTLGGFGSHHTAVTSYAPAANTCIAQLNARVVGGTFAPGIPAPNLTPPLTDNPPIARQPAPTGQGIAFPQGADTFHESYAYATSAAFDLQGQRIQMARTASGYSVTRSAGAIVPPTPAAVVIANGDDVQQTVALASAMPIPGGATSAVTVSSNGLVTLSALGSGTSFVPDASALANFAASTIAASWQDLNPGAPGSGSILFEQVGGVAYVTWNGVYRYGSFSPNTFQVQFALATGDIDVVFGATTPIGDSLVGFSVGGPSPATTDTDLSALTAPLLLVDTVVLPPIAIPGATVAVGVDTYGGYTPTSVLFLANGAVFAEDATPPFGVTLTVPTDAIGDFQVIAIAVDAQDRVAFAGPLAMPVNLTATLTGLSTFSERIQLGADGETANLTVMGDYSDGVQRNVSRPGLGTTFSSSNANIATIDPNGVITAVGEGVCTVVAQNGGYQVSVGVFVRYEADLAIVGEGCAASTGVPTLGATGVPTLGNSSFRLTATGIAVPSFTIFALQGGPALAVGVPIPGAPACALGHVLPSVTVASLTDPSGIANLPLPIPANPALAGAVVSAQVAVWDPALVGYALPIGTSAALQVTIGH